MIVCFPHARLFNFLPIRTSMAVPMAMAVATAIAPRLTVLVRRSLGLMLTLPVLGAQAAYAEAPSAPYIEVRGEAVVHAAPDQVELAITIVSEDKDPQRVMATNTARVTAVRKALTSIGLTDKELHTGQFTLQPQWSSPPVNPTPRWRAVITGFLIEHQLLVRTKNLALAGRIISTANDAGANRIGELRFTLADATPQRAEAIRAATKNALTDASNIANAAGVTLGPLQAITLEAGVPIEPMPFAAQRMAVMAESAPVPITPDAIDVRSAVLLRVTIAR